MENQRLPLIYLQWLRQNTAHYQYRTKDAELLRKKIEACGLETEEDLNALNNCYFEFVDLLERNPVCGTDTRGGEAAILAENFHYFFYENDNQQYIPIKFFLDYGGVSNPEDARKLYDRLRNSLAVWEKEALDRSFQAHEKAQYASRGVVTVYGKMLNQSRGSAAVWFGLLLMLGLLVLTGSQIFVNAGNSVYETLDDVQKAGLGFGGAMTAVFSLRWLLWIKREKLRKKTLREWDYCVKYTGDHLGSSSGSFRDPEIFKRILQYEILEAGHQSGSSGEDTRGLPQREPDYIGVLSPKSIKACNKIRPLDLLSMAAVFLCVLIAGPVKIIPQLEAPISDAEARITELLDEKELRDEKQKVYAEDKMEDILDYVQFTFQTVTDHQTLLDAPLGDGINTSYENAGAVLYPLGSEWEDDDGALWYSAIGADRYAGYLPASSCRFYDARECPMAETELKDPSGSPAEGTDLSPALDGLPLTGCTVRVGESLDLTLKSGSMIRYLYLLTGDISSEKAFKDSGKIKRLKLIFDDTKEYYVELDRTELASPVGCFIRVPDIGASRVALEVLDTTQKDGTAWLSEVKICGQRM